jgi:hypothetical protein
MNPQNLRPPWRPGESGNPGGRRSGFVGEIRRQTKDGETARPRTPGARQVCCTG